MLYLKANIGDVFDGYHPISKVLHYSTTAVGQQVAVVVRQSDNTKMFFIDAEEQSSATYHEAFNRGFIPEPSFWEESLGQVLIIGAGAGGPARFALEAGASSILQVDFDPEIIEVAKRFLPEWHCGAFDNPNVKTVIANAKDWVDDNKVLHGKFDCVFFDLTERTGASQVCWDSKFFDKLLAFLRPGGLFSTHVTWIGNDPAPKVTELFSTDVLGVRQVRTIPAASWHFFHAVKRVDL